eukprot:TRINITY_DN1172_c0_g1_i4.p1 TRINITY_DN1172_c0_g1~~TRINITY_DN1172_c0_g1_i4.p1  ORF type:complete len:348 (+),score=63.27 TRINITY_DN1172_c0_g1_i4:462-1505(+)
MSQRHQTSKLCLLSSFTFTHTCSSIHSSLTITLTLTPILTHPHTDLSPAHLFRPVLKPVLTPTLILILSHSQTNKHRFTPPCAIHLTPILILILILILSIPTAKQKKHRFTPPCTIHPRLTFLYQTEVLINPETHELKLCDFGSAKILAPGEPNVSYICSRYYRAPELIFGASDYTNAIDVWSAGCVMAELLLSQPIFAGESGVDQLVEIIKIIGTPTREEVIAMNPECKEYKTFPQLKKQKWDRIFPPGTSESAMDLVDRMLLYNPTGRIHPFQACAHCFFDQLRELHSGGNSQQVGVDKLPPLFNLTVKEFNYAREKNLLSHLLPQAELEGLNTNLSSMSPTCDV